eukprot:scaffold81736_cov29-Tisochrysis_lutea.AAC.4
MLPCAACCGLVGPVRRGSGRHAPTHRTSPVASRRVRVRRPEGREGGGGCAGGGGLHEGQEVVGEERRTAWG